MMTANPKNASKKSNTDSPATPSTESHTIDRQAPAGTGTSLGAESVRDGRPATKDDVVEAKDEMPPGTPS
jgi:hypothetical protein